MLTSKELIAQAGVSRATLNNYISLGLIPRPDVKAPDASDSKARRIGYFPEAALDRIREIDDLKRRGLRMSEIVTKLSTPPPRPSKMLKDRVRDVTNDRLPTEKVGAAVEAPAQIVGQRGLRLTIEGIDYPAYLVNNKFEIEWANGAAEEIILGRAGGLSTDIADRNIFRLLLESAPIAAAESREELLQFHLGLAKNRLTKAALLTLDKQMAEPDIEKLADLYDATEDIEAVGVRDTEVNMAARSDTPLRHHVFATFFREGIFFAYVPAREQEGTLLEILARRDLVIRDLLRSRRPYMTPLAVLVADIEESVKICAELPPEEYFELINEVWGTMEPLFRKYYATHGKHVGDGILYYFFPQPDCNYVLNALACAAEMKQAMLEINERWRMRKNWMNELKLNIGIDEGDEWFGAYQTPTHLEFTVLGDTVNRAARLSDFAGGGSVWATKNMLGKLNSREREQVVYGVRRRSHDDREIIISSTYARISNLIDIDDPKFTKVRDIAHMPITEVLSLVNRND